jgi:hypothetical protein
VRPIPGIKVEYLTGPNWFPWAAYELDENGYPNYRAMAYASTRIGLRYACWRVRARRRKAARMSARGPL